MLALAAFAFALSTSPARLAALDEAAEQVHYERCLKEAHSKPQEALKDAETWRSGGGGYPAAHCAGVALVTLKRYEEAAKQLAELSGQMMTAPAALRADAMEQAGEAWLLANRAAEAKDAFDAALSLQPDDPDLLIDRAQAWADLNRYDAAAADLDQALEHASYRVDAYVFRASARRHLPGRLDDALTDVEHALRLAPDTATALLERGTIRAMKGDQAGARADWQRVETLAPKSAVATAAAEHLARLSEKDDAGK